jgi:hypothetical protein
VSLCVFHYIICIKIEVVPVAIVDPNQIIHWRQTTVVDISSFMVESDCFMDFFSTSYRRSNKLLPSNASFIL